MKMKNRGTILIPLLVAMVVLALIIGALASLQSSKHVSESLYVQSTQAYAVAQAGVEWAIRYATDNSSTFFSNPAALFPQTKSFGNGSFTVSYNSVTQKLASTSQVQDGRRTIVLSSFPNYLPSACEISLDPSNLPSHSAQKKLLVPLLNNSGVNLYIFQVDLAKTGGSPAQLNLITLGSTDVWSGNKVNVSSNQASPTAFPFNLVTYYTLTTSGTNMTLTLQGDGQVAGTWYCTIHYSKSTSLSNPQTCTLTFTVT